MSLVILPNTAGSAAASITINTGARASGYRTEDVIHGPRSRMFRSQATSGSVRVGYTHDSDLSIDTVVVARADKLLTQDGMRIRFQERDSVDTWSDLTTPDYNTLASSDLIGRHGQDLVASVSPTDLRGVGITVSAGGAAEAIQFSKLYGSLAFDMGTQPVALSNPSRWRYQDAYAKPLRGWYRVKTEAEITIHWSGVTAEKAAAFEAIPRLLEWPFFLYEDNASAISLFEHRLEHVIIAEPYTIVRHNNGFRDITATFRRLKHYEVN